MTTESSKQTLSTSKAALSPRQNAYREFFLKALKKFNPDAKSPADLDKETKSKFFSFLKRNWKHEKMRVAAASAESTSKAKLSPLQAAYKKLFLETLESFGVTSPADLSVKKRSKFFEAVQKAWVKRKRAINKVSESSDLDIEFESFSKEQTAGQKAYREFFIKTLKEFDPKAKSPFKLSKDDQKKFFAAIKEGWAKEKATSTSGSDDNANDRLVETIERTSEAVKRSNPKAENYKALVAEYMRAVNAYLGPRVSTSKVRKLTPYQEFFKATLKEFDPKAKSPFKLSKDDQKKFFAAIKEGWAKEKAMLSQSSDGSILSHLSSIFGNSNVHTQTLLGKQYVVYVPESNDRYPYYSVILNEKTKKFDVRYHILTAENRNNAIVIGSAPNLDTVVRIIEMSVAKKSTSTSNDAYIEKKNGLIIAIERAQDAIKSCPKDDKNYEAYVKDLSKAVNNYLKFKGFDVSVSKSTKPLSPKQQAYREFFMATLKEFDPKAKSPASLDEATKKKFFTSVKNGWKKQKSTSSSESDIMDILNAYKKESIYAFNAFNSTLSEFYDDDLLDEKNVRLAVARYTLHLKNAIATLQDNLISNI